jgi:hypothetical protein
LISEKNEKSENQAREAKVKEGQKDIAKNAL